MTPAIAEQSPATTYTHTVTFFTGTPESSAARALPPVAYSQRPKVVRASTSAITSATTTMISTPIGMPRMRLKPSHSKPVLPSPSSPERSLMVRPFVISSATPRTT